MGQTHLSDTVKVLTKRATMIVKTTRMGSQAREQQIRLWALQAKKRNLLIQGFVSSGRSWLVVRLSILLWWTSPFALYNWRFCLSVCNQFNLGPLDHPMIRLHIQSRVLNMVFIHSFNTQFWFVVVTWRTIMARVDWNLSRPYLEQWQRPQQTWWWPLSGSNSLDRRPISIWKAKRCS